MSAGKQKRGTRESTIEAYLVEQVEKHGGMCEKFVSPGRRGVPDRIVTWPAYGFARVHFVEVKAIGGKLDPAQVRDHARRRKLNCFVQVVWSRMGVDSYVSEYAPAPRP
jgi:hypothetical protein